MRKLLIAACLTMFALPAMADQIVGIGIAIQKDRSNFAIAEVLTGGPAQHAGLHVGEHIYAVDGVATHGKSLEQVVNAIRGPVGTHVSLTVGADANHVRNVEMIRAVIQYQDACFLEGSVNLQTNAYAPGSQPTMVNGSIGGRSFQGTISGSFVYAYVNGQSFNLNYGQTGSQNYIQGWIRGTYVSWYGSGNSIFGYQPCIK